VTAPAPIRNPLLRWVRNVAIAVDDLASAIFFGDGQETISSRLGKAQEGRYGPFWKKVTSPLRIAVNWVARKVFGQANHCEASIEEDRGSAAEEIPLPRL